MNALFSEKFAALIASGSVGLSRQEAQACHASGPEALNLMFKRDVIFHAWGGCRSVLTLQGDAQAFQQLGLLLLCSALVIQSSERWVMSSEDGHFMVFRRDPFHAGIDLHGLVVEQIAYHRVADVRHLPAALFEDDGQNPAFHLYEAKDRRPLAADRFCLVFDEDEPTGFKSALQLHGTALARLRLGRLLLDWAFMPEPQPLSLERRRFEVSSVLESEDASFLMTDICLCPHLRSS